MVTSKMFLRLAALLIAVHLLGHTGGHLKWDKPDDPKMQAVVDSMKGYSSEFMGATKSMADYFNGYSLIMFGLFAMSIAIIWFVSGFINQHRHIATKVLYPVGLAYMAFGVIEYVAFFPFAALISFMAGVLVLLAITVVKN